ncbi:envelope glycoprotein M [Bovine alphaherpesvirus 2]|uniref:Envelope glycoprotein M n=1 Tax=Bovine alphaherpesvirus 2 TaxID=10295 RepID=A0A7T1L7K3_9ALPH|nr:envelope glycoprotein M [Bovine alphaherpesvirus 2]
MVLSEMAPRVEPAHARISWRIWCVQAVAFALSSLCLVGLLIVAYFFDAGFPCFYATAAVRVGVNNTHHAVVRGGVAIALGLGAQSVVGTYVTTAVALVAAAIYMLAGAATSKYRHDMDTGTRLAAVYMVAPQTTLVFGAACPWLLQITVILLSHRILMLAHVMYVLHFVCLACFAFHFCTRGVFSGTYVRQVHSMIDAAPTHHRVIGPIRAVMTNVLLLVAFMSSAAAAASVNAVVASNFNTSAPGMIVTTAGAFAALIVCLLLVVEFLLSHYVHVLLGPHLGAIAAAGMVGVATEYYYSSSYYVTETQWSGVHGGTRAVLAIVAVFVLIMAVVRIVRAYLHHRGHHTKFFRHMRATKNRAKSALQRVRGSMQGVRRGAGPRTSAEPMYPAARYEPMAESEGYGGEEPIYEDVASDGDEEIYARVGPKEREEPIYDTVSDW